MQKESDEQRRRLAWLQQEVPDIPQNAILVRGGGDRYNADPEQYVGKSGRMPHGWAKAVHTASLIHIDEMRTLLEMHYDDAHFEKYREQEAKKLPKRKTEHNVFKKAISLHRKRLCQRIDLPEHVKAVLRTPDDENCWSRLEMLRGAVARTTLGERSVEVIDEEMASSIADALERSRQGRCVKAFVDEVGPGSPYVPEGSRLLITVKGGPSRRSFVENRSAIATAVRKMAGKTLPVHTRPVGTIRTPPMDDFAMALLRNPKDLTLQKAAAEEGLKTKADTLDRMLLCLFDALFLDQCETWSERGVSNLPADETPELARYFIKGLNVGTKPIFDAMRFSCQPSGDHSVLPHATQQHKSVSGARCVGPCSMGTRRSTPPHAVTRNSGHPWTAMAIGCRTLGARRRWASNRRASSGAALFCSCTDAMVCSQSNEEVVAEFLRQGAPRGV